MCINFYRGPLITIFSLLFFVVTQLIVGLPFLLVDAESYFRKAFEFKRVFMFKWSVNWQFLGEKVATGNDLASILLLAHFGLLLTFLLFKWTHINKGVGSWLSQIRLRTLTSTSPIPLNPYYVAISVFTCNLIGVLCARSLHY